ncbi:hypothetical protein [Siphonobacter sp. SORGH_AS_0500]|uniref:hypothetical protein n=1 Tax=Siphonobacter sp. SORGH_AS_0500 TaxID=1864824 RepID=UPI00286738A0|nr:hypothetical protein [Siphonobacter sp. SORGH_AS_0500]MDR6196154.1 hypothetical protein [Siphonobacter sp. SORGH_AS_0500]
MLQADVNEDLHKLIHRNVPQLMMYMVRASINVAIWGRATGKTEGVTSVLALHNVVTMPGSVGAIGCTSYTHLIGEIIPELIGVWKEKIGLREGVHFWVREFPPKELNVPQAKRPLQECNHAIFFCNGSAIKFFSINHQALKNGDSIDWMIVEEARLAKYAKLKEMFLCLRGNKQFFGHLPQHGSLTLVTDMPRTPEDAWIMEYRKQMNDVQVQYILELEQQISLRYWKLQKTRTQSARERLEKEMQQFKAEADKVRKDTVYVSFASTLDNMHALGDQTIKMFIRSSTSRLDSELSILNRIQERVKNCFYPSLSQTKQGRDAVNYTYVSKLRGDVKKDSRWQSDIDLTLPLEISLDYNAIFSSMLIGQFHDHENRLHFCKNLYVNHPDRLSKLVHNFCDYFEHHPTKEVIYYFDHTATGEDAEKRREEGETFDQIVIKVLEERGWLVTPVYTGQPWGHKTRYEEIAKIMEGDQDAQYTFTFNIEECREWMEACQDAMAIRKTTERGGTVTAKDKTSERPNSPVAPVKATHLTEAGDGLYYGRACYGPAVSTFLPGLGD